MYRLFFFSVFFLGLLSCYEETTLFDEPESPQTGTYPNVDQNLWSHFANFEKEAAARGFNIELNRLRLNAVISEIAENGVLGQCQYSSQYPNRVTIDKTFWSRSSELYREFVVFHELGHCVLDRDHKEDQDQRGLCLSIMRSGLGDCRDAYNSVNRTYYLNELFENVR